MVAPSPMEVVTIPVTTTAHTAPTSALLRSLLFGLYDFTDLRRRRRTHCRRHADFPLQSVPTFRAPEDMLFDPLDFNFGKLPQSVTFDQLD
jgi:hypothetical protein